MTTLALSSFGLALARAQEPEQKHASPPPQLADVKTPAPAAPAKEPLSAEEELAQQSAALTAPIPAKSLRTVGSGFLAGLGASEVMFDTPGDGRIWAAADHYKASFGAEGATYIPFFGSRAPENHPVQFAIRSIHAGASEIAFDAAAQPVRQGNRIVFDRGIVDEVYDLTLDSIEQSFVFESVPERGELVIELAVASEMDRSADLHGLVFTSESGSVRYTSAVAIDASGARAGAPTTWSGDAIAIRVGAQDVARAAFPLVVDPIVSTFDVDDNASEDHFSPDVAYDSTNNRWLAVYERAFSSTDHDIYSKLLTLTGGLVSATFIDVSTTYWADPSVANNNLDNIFLTVAEVGDPSGGARIIRGRTREAAGTGTSGIQFTISGAEIGDKMDAVVGGDPVLVGPTHFCVVWKRYLSSADTDIHARLVDADSTIFGGTIFLSNSGATLDGAPAISKGDGVEPFSLQDWNIAFTRNESLFDNDLYAARIHWDGTVSASPFALDTGSSNTLSPSVSSSIDATARDYVVAYTISPLGGDANVYGKLLRDNLVIDTVNLSSATGAPLEERQISSAVDSDGHSFVLVNAETYQGSTTDYDIYASTLVSIGNQLLVSEGHVNLAFSGFPEDQPRIACPEASGEGFSLNRPTFAIWHQLTASGNGDIEAATYNLGSFTSLCTPGSNGIIACPCGNAPGGANRGCDNSSGTGGARLTATGNVIGDTVVLHAQDMLANALCIFGQGNASLSTGTTFGDGVRCATGGLLRLATKAASGGAANFPGLGDPSVTERAAQLGAPIVSGDRRFYYTYYRDPVGFACAATFNSTNTMMVQW